MRANVYRVHGMMQSYFTRKMTGYLDYKGIPWVFRRFPGVSPEAMAAGFPGGVPVVQDARGRVHVGFDGHDPPPRAALPRTGRPAGRSGAALPLLRARGCRRRVALPAGGRDAAGTSRRTPPSAASSWHATSPCGCPSSCDQAHAAVGAHVRSSCPPLGVTADTIQLLGRRRPAAVDARPRRAPRAPAVPLRRAPVARRLRALRRQRRTLRQRPPLPPLGGGGWPRRRAAHAPSAGAGGSGVRRVGRPAPTCPRR